MINCLFQEIQIVGLSIPQLKNVTVSNNTAVSVRANGGHYIVACLTMGLCIRYDVVNSTSSVRLHELIKTTFQW